PDWNTASGYGPLLLPEIIPLDWTVGTLPSVLITYPVLILFSSLRFMSWEPVVLVPIQLFHGNGASYPASPKFTNTDLVSLSITYTFIEVVASPPLPSFNTTTISCTPRFAT